MQPAEDSFTFSVQSRIKSSLQIKDIVTARKSVNAFPLKCFYRLVQRKEENEDAAIAVVVPKRRFKHAVDRNRLKRLIREAYRTHKYHFPNTVSKNRHLQICWIYVSPEIADYETIVLAIEKTYYKINEAINTEE